MRDATEPPRGEPDIPRQGEGGGVGAAPTEPPNGLEGRSKTVEQRKHVGADLKTHWIVILVLAVVLIGVALLTLLPVERSDRIIELLLAAILLNLVVFTIARATRRF